MNEPLVKEECCCGAKFEVYRTEETLYFRAWETLLMAFRERHAACLPPPIVNHHHRDPWNPLLDRPHPDIERPPFRMPTGPFAPLPERPYTGDPPPDQAPTTICGGINIKGNEQTGQTLK